MNQAVKAMKNLLELSWTYSAICIFCVFLFPEYTAPIFALLSLFFAYKDAKLRRSSLKIGVAGKLIWLYILSMFFTLLYSSERLSTVATIFMWIIMFSVYISLVTIITTKRRLFQFIVMLSIVFGIMGFLSCVEYFGCVVFNLSPKTLQFWNFLDELVFKLYPGEIHLYSSGIRTASTFSNPNIFAEVMVFILPFAICALEKSKKYYLKSICVTSLLFGVVGFTFSFSRASYICLIAIIIAFFVFNPMQLKLRKYLLYLGLTVSIILVLCFVPNIYASRMATLQLEEHSVSERIHIWSAAFDAIVAHPILGYGAGIQTTTNIMTSAGLPITVPHAHNLYLQLTLEGGIFAVITFMLPTIRALFMNVLITIKTKAYKCYGFASMLSIAMFFCFGMVEFPLLTPKLVGTFYLLISLSDITEKYSPDLTTYVNRRKEQS